jgi:hypothetical protein
MNTKYTAAIMLIILGLVVLADSGIAYTTQGPQADNFGLRFETTRSHSFPPIVGVLPLIGGIIVLVARPTRAQATESPRVTKPKLAVNGGTPKRVRRLVPPTSTEGLSYARRRVHYEPAHLRNRCIDASDAVHLSPSNVG